MIPFGEGRLWNHYSHKEGFSFLGKVINDKEVINLKGEKRLLADVSLEEPSKTNPELFKDNSSQIHRWFIPYKEDGTLDWNKVTQC